MGRFLAFVRQGVNAEHGICLVFIAGASICVIAPYVAGSAIPLDIPATLTMPGPDTSEADALERAGWQNAFYYRSFRYMNRVATSEGSLLWDPREFAGKPFLGDPATRALSPFSIPFYFVNIVTAFWISLFAKLILAGWSTFYVARVLGLPKPLSAYAGCAFMLSGVLVVWGGHPASDVAPWIPLLILFAERLSLGQWRYWPGGALVVGAVLLSGAMLAAFASLAFAGVYLTVRRRSGLNVTASGRTVVISAVVALLIGVSLAMIQLAPAVEWWLHSHLVWTARSASPGLETLSRIVGPVWDHGAGRMLAARTAALIHVGAIPTFLSALWLVLRPFAPLVHKRRIDALLGLGVVWLTATTLWLILQGYASFATVVPIVDLMVPVSFVFSLGSAAVAAQWLELGPGPSFTTFRRYIGIVAVLIAVGAAGFGLTYLLRPAMAPELFLTEITVGGLTAAVFCLAFGISLVRPKPRLFGYTLAVASALQLLLVYLPLAPKTAHDPLGELAGVVTETHADNRVAFGEEARQAGRYALHASTLGGFAPRAPAGTHRFIETAATDPALTLRSGVDALVLSEADLCDAFVFARSQLHFAGLVPGIPGGLYRIQSSPGITSRLTTGHAIDSQGDASGPRSDRSPLIEGRFELARPSAYRVRPLIGRRSMPARISLNVIGNGPGSVVYYESAYPGWRAFVDTQPTRLIRVDGAFRAASLPESARDLTFVYAPDSYRWGAVTSLLTLSVCLMGLAHLMYHRIRNQYFRM